MLNKREIIDAGNSAFPVGDEIDKEELEYVNQELLSKGLRPIEAMIILEGITKQH